MDDTIYALSTPVGVGGIAVIRLSGPQAIKATCALFRPLKASHALSSRPSHTLTYGQIVYPNGELLDDVVVAIYRAPHSYTGEDVVEISCHGSRYIQQEILRLLAEALPADAFGHRPIRLAQHGEYTRRAYQAGHLDLTQAEAVADLIAADNAVSHRLAIHQMRGSISQRLDTLRASLLHLASLLELELDFSEEDVTFADRSELQRLTTETIDEINRLTRSYQTGRALREGIPIAIVGAPNVGKSTLLNALLGDERALVSDIAGTTRDTVEDTLDIHGIRFRLIDTAGLRHTTDQIENLGIERARLAAQHAEIILFLTEPNVPYPPLSVRPDQQAIYLVNKTDTFSALHHIGLEALEEQLVALSGAQHLTGSEVILTNHRHYEALQNAAHDLTLLQDGLATRLPTDLLAEHLRAALDTLSSLLGSPITPEDTLQEIFSHFCIGK